MPGQHIPFIQVVYVLVPWKASVFLKQKWNFFKTSTWCRWRREEQLPYPFWTKHFWGNKKQKKKPCCKKRKTTNNSPPNKGTKWLSEPQTSAPSPPNLPKGPVLWAAKAQQKKGCPTRNLSRNGLQLLGGWRKNSPKKKTTKQGSFYLAKWNISPTGLVSFRGW